MIATLAAAVVSLGVMLWAVASNAPGPLWAAAAVYALVAIAASVGLNAAYHGGRHRGPTAAVEAVASTSRITVLTYAWGGTALLLMYPVAGFWWRHNWQYGGAMLLIAVCLAAYLTLLGNTQSSLRSQSAISRAVALAWVQGIGGITALAWLIGTDKLKTLKNDWAANPVFVCGAAVLTVVSALVIVTHRRLTASHSP